MPLGGQALAWQGLALVFFRRLAVRFWPLIPTEEVMDGLDTSCEAMQRRKWAIDRLLEGLVGEQVRVAAEAFVPPSTNGGSWPRMIPVTDLILPDNSTPGGLPVFFEGRLEAFERHIGVVDVILSAPTNRSGNVADGATAFRSTTAVLLPGPARVRLA